MCIKTIAYILQRHSLSLCSSFLISPKQVSIAVCPQWFYFTLTAFPCKNGSFAWGFVLYFIPPQGDITRRRQNLYFFNLPVETIRPFPVNCIKYPTCRRRCNDRIAETFYFHLRAREASKISPHFKTMSLPSHNLSSFHPIQILRDPDGISPNIE